MGFGKSKCSACGAEIEWLKLPSGNYMACDPGRVYCVPDTNGDTYAADAAGVVTRVRKLPRVCEAKDGVWLMRIPHRTTCTAPRADYEYREKWRRAAHTCRKAEPRQEPATTPAADHAQVCMW